MKQIFFLLGLLLTLNSFSQDNEVNVQVSLDYLNSQNEKISQLRDSIKTNDSIILLLERRIKELEKSNLELTKKDVNIASFKDSIVSKDHKIKELSDELSKIKNQYNEDVSMANVRLAAVRLSLQYDSTKVKEAIRLFDSISDSSTIKQKYSWVRELLVNYGKWNKEFKEILEIAQNDNSGRHNRMNFKEFHKSVESKLRNMEYYKRAYGKGHNIPYLDNLIDKTKKCINEEDKYVDYHDVLISL